MGRVVKLGPEFYEDDLKKKVIYLNYLNLSCLMVSCETAFRLRIIEDNQHNYLRKKIVDIFYELMVMGFFVSTVPSSKLNEKYISMFVN